MLLSSAPAQLILAACDLALAPLALLVLLPVSSWLTAKERQEMPVPSGATLHHVIVSPKGRANGRLFFINGWPDTLLLFQSVARKLSAAGFECVLMSMPGFPTLATPTDLPAIIQGTIPNRKWGFSFKETCQMLANTIVSVNNARGAIENGEICLVGHDWGVIVCYILLSKHSPQELGLTRFVSLDVGLLKKMPGKMALLVAIYQIYLNIAWMCPTFLGDLLTRGMATMIDAPAKTTACAAHNGFYREMIRTVALKEWQGYKLELPREIPTVFCYGTLGPSWSWWSNQEFRDQVLATSSISRVESFAGGHWFFVGEEEDKFIKVLEEFLESRG